MNNIKKWFKRNFICPIKGHISVDRLWEDKNTIHEKCCSRCDNPLGIGESKMLDDIHPPLKSGENLVEVKLRWKNFIQEKRNEIRKKFNYKNSNKGYNYE